MVYRGKGSQGWRKIGEEESYYRSKWESNYARYLQYLLDNGDIRGWSHEPWIFRFEKITRGCTTYKPDFCVFENDGTHYWVEVKGWMDSKSKTKIKRFEKYFPNEILIVVGKEWFSKNSSKLKHLIKDWE